jgi:HIT domain
VEYEPFDFEGLRARIGSRCFICELLAGNSEFRHHVFYEDEFTVAFLNKYPKLFGYALVAPKQHRESVTADFAVDEYLALQEVVYRVGEAVRRTVPTERLYILSLGSREGKFSRALARRSPAAWGAFRGAATPCTESAGPAADH